MKDEIVGHKTSKLAKEKGFDEDCNQFYFYYRNKDEHRLIINIMNKNSVNNEEQSSAPSQSLLLRYLREEHNIVVEIRVENNQKNFSFISRIYLLNHIKPVFISNLYERYEEALEKGLFEALKLIENGR